jgi:prepilin-type N-terminal cleavage/methylation domain-containing protein
MRVRDTRGGFSLMEVMVAVALMGVMAAVAATLMRGSLADGRAKGGARNLADLLMLGRAEAIRTGDPHLLFFEADAEDGALTGPSGQAAAALLTRDLNGDGKAACRGVRPTRARPRRRRRTTTPAERFPRPPCRSPVARSPSPTVTPRAG